jgi:hypothetical protein
MREGFLLPSALLVMLCYTVQLGLMVVDVALGLVFLVPILSL